MTPVLVRSPWAMSLQLGVVLGVSGGGMYEALVRDRGRPGYLESEVLVLQLRIYRILVVKSIHKILRKL